MGSCISSKNPNRSIKQPTSPLYQPDVGILEVRVLQYSLNGILQKAQDIHMELLCKTKYLQCARFIKMLKFLAQPATSAVFSFNILDSKGPMTGKKFHLSIKNQDPKIFINFGNINLDELMLNNRSVNYEEKSSLQKLVSQITDREICASLKIQLSYTRYKVIKRVKFLIHHYEFNQEPKVQKFQSYYAQISYGDQIRRSPLQKINGRILKFDFQTKQFHLIRRVFSVNVSVIHVDKYNRQTIVSTFLILTKQLLVLHEEIQSQPQTVLKCHDSRGCLYFDIITNHENINEFEELPSTHKRYTRINRLSKGKKSKGENKAQKVKCLENPEQFQKTVKITKEEENKTTNKTTEKKEQIKFYYQE